MTIDQNSEEMARTLLSKATENPWLIPSIINPALQGEILLHIFKNWKSYNSKEKLAILFLIFCIKRSTITALENEISEIILAGSSDLDEWVRLVSKMMIDYPRTGVLDLAVEKYLPVDIQNGLRKLIEKIENKEIKFHPVEYAFMDKDICSSFSMISKDSESETFRQSTPSYFILRKDYEISREQRLNALNNLPTVPMSPGLISPISASGFNFNIDSNRSHTLQNIPQSNSVANRQTPTNANPRRMSQPYPKTNPLLPGPINTRGFSNGPPGTESPTEIKITQGKKYQKESKIQMIDITTGSSIIRNQEETKLKTQLEEAQMKEQRRIEREKKQEERRKEEDEKKQSREKERIERLRQKEVARVTKEKEKQEKATARTEVTSASTNTASETTKRQGSGYRKRKKLNDETEDTSMEEIITEGENPHKSAQIMFSSPKSPLSPPNISHDFQTNLSPTSPINESGMMQDISEVNLEVNNNSQNIDLSNLSIKLPQRIIEILDRKTNEERQQILEHIYEVLEKANMLDEQNKELIIYFLADLHNEVKGQLINISDGLNGPDDVTRRLDLNVERITRYDEGKEIHETFIFEMNLADGTWRKLKKTKTKLVKNVSL